MRFLLDFYGIKGINLNHFFFKIIEWGNFCCEKIKSKWEF